MSYRLKILTYEDWVQDPETFLKLIKAGEIAQVIRCETNDARIDKCIRYASRMCKELCHKQYAQGIGHDDVDGYFAQMAIAEPDSFVNATDGTKAMYRFVAIHVGRMIAHGLLRKRAQKKLAKALSVKINTMTEASIYKRINEGVNIPLKNEL